MNAIHEPFKLIYQPSPSIRSCLNMVIVFVGVDQLESVNCFFLVILLNPEADFQRAVYLGRCVLLAENVITFPGDVVYLK